MEANARRMGKEHLMRSYGRALRSLKAWPGVLRNRADLMQVPHIGKVIAELLDPVLAEYYASQAYIRSQALATANAIVAPATPPRVSSTREALMAATSTPFSVEAWLKAISCDRYLDKFLELGYDNVLVLQELTDEDLNTLGIQLAGHRRTLLLAAQRLKEGADATATATTTTVAAAAAAVAAAAATPAPSISPPLLGKRRAAPGDTTTAKRRKITGSALVSVAPVALPAPTPAAATSPVWTGGDAGAAPTTPTTTTTNRSPREYIPRFRTGAWAVLVALHRMTTEAQKHFTQEEIIAVAEPYCDASFYKDFRDGHFWSAWDSTKTLFKHGLAVEVATRPPRFGLTASGAELAAKIVAKLDGQPVPNSSPSASPSTPPDRRTSPSFRETPSPSTPTPPTKKSPGTSMHPTSPVLYSASTPASLLRSHSTVPCDLDDRASDDEDSQDGSMELPTELDSFDPPRPGELKHFFDIAPEQRRLISRDVIVLVDTRERPKFVPGMMPREPMHVCLESRGYRAESRSLAVGDIMWVARYTYGHVVGGIELIRNDEFVMNFILERKTLVDFESSIFDGRFEEQKFRMHRSNIANILYLVEGNLDRLPQYCRAIMADIAVDGIKVVSTQSEQDSLYLIGAITNYIVEKLTAIPEDSFLDLSEDTNECVADKQSLFAFTSKGTLLRYSEFTRGAAKSRNLTLGDIFSKQLLQIPSVSTTKASVVLQHYATPAELLYAYSKLATEEERRSMLADLRSKDGSRIGPAASNAIFQCFQQRLPASVTDTGSTTSIVV